MAIYDEVVAPIAADLLACLTTEIAKVPDPPAQVCIRVGDRTDLLIGDDDDECCSGLAWVRWARQYHTGGNWPDENLGIAPCSPQLGLVFELGVARCAPTTTDTSVPGCDLWLAAAAVQFADLAALRRTACCYAEQSRRVRKVAYGPAAPQTTEGGCISVAMQLVVSALVCDPTCTS